MRRQPVRVEYARVRGEHVARRAARPELGGAGVERLAGGGVVALMQRLGRPTMCVRMIAAW